MLVTCADHKKAPGVVVCVHCFDHQAKLMYPVSSGPPQEEPDWLCEECVKQFPDVPLDLLKMVCMHCARELPGKRWRPS